MSSDPRTSAVLFPGLLLAAALALGAGPVRAGAPEFDGERAMSWIRFQCELGPRTPGSPGNIALRQRISALADSLGLEARADCFTAEDPLGGDSFQACNLVVTVPGQAAGPDLWLGAHFDSRPVSDRDPDPARRSEPLVGANDGGSGTAVLLHLLELLAASPPPRGVALLFFDAEDSGRSGDVAGFCLGSRRLAEGWGEFSSPLPAAMPQGLVVLDMVGERNAAIPQEAYSLALAPDWTQEVFSRAARLGLDALVPEPGAAVYDDHVPFLQRGVPAVDLIDFDFPQWHTSADTPEVCSPASLEQVGRLMVDLIYNP